MAFVSDETLGELQRELDHFRSAVGHNSLRAAAHLAGAAEAVLEEASASTRCR
jgi:hypothetical protein